MVGVITIVFAITVFMPGDPAAALLDKNATQEQIDEVHARLGLDKPVLERCGEYALRYIHSSGDAHALRWAYPGGNSGHEASEARCSRAF